MTTATKTKFAPGDKVIDRRDTRTKAVAVLLSYSTPSGNGSRKWMCRYPDMTIAIWETDLRHAETAK
jgi:hypothetical protein